MARPDSTDNLNRQSMDDDMSDYVIQVLDHPNQLNPAAYDHLLSLHPQANPFLSHAYFTALLESGSACDQTGWLFRCVTIEQQGRLVAACPGYIKNHSAGEYVFDQAWAQAYARHGLAYYPKFTVAPAFTPVPGNRLLAATPQARDALLRALEQWATVQGLSSIHLLFCAEEDLRCAEHGDWLIRKNVQFHWQNRKPQPYQDFEEFLLCLNQEKRKKIRQERRKVTQAGVQFRILEGTAIQAEDWAFFYDCYHRTYAEHGRPPYLSPDFFAQVAQTMANNWVLFIAHRDGRPIAASLLGLNDLRTTAYGRYWGALERVDCLHFETCYYQPIQWCIDHQVHRFEGGAQGEHKMARALLPTMTHSLHWIANPAFKQAIARSLDSEGPAVDHYLEHLTLHSPFKPGGPSKPA